MTVCQHAYSSWSYREPGVVICDFCGARMPCKTGEDMPTKPIKAKLTTKGGRTRVVAAKAHRSVSQKIGAKAKADRIEKELRRLLGLRGNREKRR